jgi:voltage-gated potassium channel
MKPNWRRLLHAQWRDGRVLLRESRAALGLFLVVILGGAVLLRLFYTFPGTTTHPSFGEALYAAFALIFFQPVLPFPEQWTLRILYFVVPILGLVALADGVIRFGTALIDKRQRGQKWQAAMASTYRDHVIVCGLGKVGYRVILELRKFGREVVGVERDVDGRFVEKVQALGIPVIIADARREEMLVKAGVAQADVIIPCTEDELTNLDIALDARDLNPGIKIVMRMFDPELAERVERGFGIHTAFSVSALAAPSFAAAAMRLNVQHSFYVGETLVNLSELIVAPGSRLDGQTVAEVEAGLDMSVMSYVGGGIVDLHPKPAQILRAGDKITVLATLEILKQLDGLNRPVKS